MSLITGVPMLLILLARTMISSYCLSVEALQLTAGLILLIWSLNALLQRGGAMPGVGAHPSPVELAMSPLTTPVIITPAGVAALCSGRTSPAATRWSPPRWRWCWC